MQIRKITLKDYEAVYGLWLSCKGMDLNTVDDSRDGIERFMRRNPDTCSVAESDDVIVGAIIAGSDGRRGYYLPYGGKSRTAAAGYCLKACGGGHVRFGGNRNSKSRPCGL